MPSRESSPPDIDLERFLTAQEPVFSQALAELKAGRKQTHWMWFIFPQIEGLGSSVMARRYAIRHLEEARAYWRHPVLGPRLLACMNALLEHSDRSARAILGSPDDLKLRSCMTLFAAAAEDAGPFHRVLAVFCSGAQDPLTRERLLRDDSLG